MEFYHSLVTEKSFRYLQDFRRRYDFVLIGGWAVFLYSQALKSKDIDIVIDYAELARLKEEHDVFKNDRLKKYEIKTGEFDVDIYLPHYSNLGIVAEDIMKAVTVRNGFKVPSLEILFLLKVYAWQGRQGSTKGQKDELDLISLAILPEFDWQMYLDLMARHGFKEYHVGFVALLKRIVEVKELGLNTQQMAKKRKAILKLLGE